MQLFRTATANKAYHDADILQCNLYQLPLLYNTVTWYHW